jgi:hypothetical protein
MDRSLRTVCRSEVRRRTWGIARRVRRVGSIPCRIGRSGKPPVSRASEWRVGRRFPGGRAGPTTKPFLYSGPGSCPGRCPDIRVDGTSVRTKFLPQSQCRNGILSLSPVPHTSSARIVIRQSGCYHPVIAIIVLAGGHTCRIEMVVVAFSGF